MQTPLALAKSELDQDQKPKSPNNLTNTAWAKSRKTYGPEDKILHDSSTQGPIITYKIKHD